MAGIRYNAENAMMMIHNAWTFAAGIKKISKIGRRYGKDRRKHINYLYRKTGITQKK